MTTKATKLAQFTRDLVYDNVTKVISGVSAGGKITVSSTAPVSPQTSDQWIHSNTGKRYTYINDGVDGFQWVEI